MEHLWNEFWDIFRQGLNQISNPIVGIFIALIGGLMARSIVSVFSISLLAVIVHVLADIVIPMAVHGAAMVLPTLNHAFFVYALTLYVAYFVVIFVILMVKNIFASVRG
jgi:hypothetical protein